MSQRVYPIGQLLTADGQMLVYGAVVYRAPYWIVVDAHLEYTTAPANPSMAHIIPEQRVGSVVLRSAESIEARIRKASTRRYDRGDGPVVSAIRWPTDAEVEAHVASIWRPLPSGAPWSGA